MGQKLTSRQSPVCGQSRHLTDQRAIAGCGQPKFDFCCSHTDGSGPKRSSTWSVLGCRPETIASTMSGESNVSRSTRLRYESLTFSALARSAAQRIRRSPTFPANDRRERQPSREPCQREAPTTKVQNPMDQ